VRKLKIGIVGCGAIGSEIALACVGLLKEKVELKAIFDISEAKTEGLSKKLNKKITAGSLSEVFKKSDLIVEAAGSGVSAGILRKAIRAKRDVLIMSVGGLINHSDLIRKARRKKIRVFLPSGAICGIDGLKSAQFSEIKEVTLTTKKPPRGLLGAPYLKMKNIDIGSIKKEKLIFKGSALEAVRGFPKNINVASLLSIAGLGARRTTVQIITSPDFSRNTHEVTITGGFGRITTKTENVPSEKNPKTSKLAYLSAIATLSGAVDSIKIGT